MCCINLAISLYFSFMCLTYTLQYCRKNLIKSVKDTVINLTYELKVFYVIKFNGLTVHLKIYRIVFPKKWKRTHIKSNIIKRLVPQCSFKNTRLCNFLIVDTFLNGVICIYKNYINGCSDLMT